MTTTVRMLAVCARVRCFDDDLSAPCAHCHRRVYFRPHSTRLPIEARVCLDCHLAHRTGRERHLITADTLRELLLMAQPTGRPQ